MGIGLPIASKPSPLPSLLTRGDFFPLINLAIGAILNRGDLNHAESATVALCTIKKLPGVFRSHSRVRRDCRDRDPRVGFFVAVENFAFHWNLHPQHPYKLFDTDYNSA